MKTRNITFNLPADLIRRAKIYAAERDTTINAVIRELLTRALSNDERTRAAADRLLSLANRGPYFNADPNSIPREELHERR